MEGGALCMRGGVGGWGWGWGWPAAAAAAAVWVEGVRRLLQEYPLLVGVVVAWGEKGGVGLVQLLPAEAPQAPHHGAAAPALLLLLPPPPAPLAAAPRPPPLPPQHHS